LADLGADVIKVEAPTGEHYRTAMDGAILLANNHGKRDIAIDLRRREGQEIALNLTSKADVLTENFVPGTIEKLGLGYDRVKAISPSIVYCSVSGFGQEGPYSRRPSYDPVAQAMAGIMIATGEPDGKPVRQVTSLIDMTASLYAAVAILACLRERERTGKGQRIDVSLLDTALSAMNYYVTWHSFTGKLPTRQGSGAVGWAPYQAFDTKNGAVWIGVSVDRFWRAFCQALDLDELAEDPRYATDVGRRQHRDELVDRVAKICSKYSREDLESRLVGAGVPCARLATVAEAGDNPQVRFRQVLEEFEYPGKGKIRTVRTPIMIGGHLPEMGRQAPLLGEHTVELLREYGYNDLEIQGFLDRGSVVQDKPREA
jgi:crotonobetainyl-CoA:carnitine CoA-transferase CaiB-like acyl-CoA transferase